MTSTSPTTERIQALDVLRGVAVAGILLANVLVFFGLFIIPPDRAAALPSASRDAVALFLDKVFVDGKFYSVFSLLFGIGFGLQLAAGGVAALPRFKRRLRILLAIGAIHAFLIWAGDILMLYALLGFTLPWFARKSSRELLRWALILLAIPTALYVVVLAAWVLVGFGTPATGANAGMPANILAVFEAMGRGGVKDAFAGNLVFVAIRWADLFATVRFPKVLGMFVLGLWAVRAGLVQSPASHRAPLVRWCLLGWGVGPSMNVIAALALHRWPYLPPSLGGLLGVVGQAVGVPMLALGYAAHCTAGRGWPALYQRVRARRPHGVDELPDAFDDLRRALVRLWAGAVVANRRLDGDGDRRRDHRAADPVEHVVAVSLPLRASRVDLAPAYLPPAARAARVVVTEN